METISRLAYGFRTFESYRHRVQALCGYSWYRGCPRFWSGAKLLILNRLAPQKRWNKTFSQEFNLLKIKGEYKVIGEEWLTAARGGK
jgi:hypothetical protein